ncbi:enoyl-CoA hydratase/isomerase family protein [Trypanosoma conorhini]|uniref:Enoyl-CoA hydratase/isomerase family protein n=1 Tax=Trypanosoma conorhini TaxID=83891 RepID=A0A3S5ITB6_9TRYP|nr:enoyl-CoA hydratase/isomerase family protein [Trypanosoma conorhini]RNF17336.1 enoyl-CoA hydratase/isomerase family protein [Trypanosoma conorhini]
MRRNTWLRSAAGQLLADGECRLTRLADHVGVLALNRPSRKNAVGHTLLRELGECIRMCRDPANAIHCLVLESQVDGVFCAGSDLKERRTMSFEAARAFVQNLSDTFTAFEDLPMPTIAAVEGKALGGGCELALCADMRVAGAAATFALPETGLAIIPGAGGTYRAPLAMGLSRALHLMLTAEQVTAERALQLGLVNEVAPKGEASAAALALARRIARNGPVALVAAKAAARGGYGRPRDEGMACEAAQYDVVLGTEDRLEGLRAFAEKRPPKYVGK